MSHHKISFIKIFDYFRKTLKYVLGRLTYTFEKNEEYKISVYNARIVGINFEI